MSQRISLKSLIAPHFYGVAWDVIEHRHTHYWLKGGRGSAKSSFAALMLLLLLIQHEKMHAVVLRKVGNTIKDSVYAQLLWAIEVLGLAGQFKAGRSPMELTYTPTGQKILFRGADDPMKIKSIKAPFGYFGITWFEELDQFSGPEEIRSINQSVMRGGDDFWIFYSYNPPKSRDNWVNVEAMKEFSDRLVHSSTYLTVPHAWLSEAFIDAAEGLKASNLRAYEHEYLGVATGTGGAVFENLAEREITGEEIARMERFRYGLDFGFAVDPLAWIKMSFDRKHRTLYILDEIYEQKLKNSIAAQKILQREPGRVRIIADSAEPKSIAEMIGYGLLVIPCKKGPDSVEHGMKWLQDLNEIVIDKRRTPNAYREFSLYEYEQNRDGRYISAYPDKNNHLIDAARYGCMLEMYADGWGFGTGRI